MLLHVFKKAYSRLLSNDMETNLRLRLHDDGPNRRRKSGVAYSLFIPRLGKRFRKEICVHTVTQKCVDFDWVCISGGYWSDLFSLCA